MNEFLQQFLVESRELVDQASDELLSLEKQHDPQRFDDAFRAFHTLKGGAGIVEFMPMQAALHAAEGAFTAARAAARPLSALDIGNCLKCLDQVVDWLDTVESTGELPVDADAAAVIARFAPAPQPAPDGAAAGLDARDGWRSALLRTHAAAVADARTALRYRPPADSFFRQQDPFARIGALPGLLAIDAGPRTAWPPLDAFDPFACNLSITALLSASPAETAAALGDELRHCDVEALGAAAPLPEASLPPLARELLEAQLLLLAAPGESLGAGHIASAGSVAANVLRRLGRLAEAQGVAAEAAAAVAGGGARRLAQVISAIVAGTPAAAAAEPAAARRPDARTRTLRVNADRIDSLVRLTGELTVVKNSIGHAVKLAESDGSALAVALKNQHAGLDRLVCELQRAVVGMRVLPLRVAFQRFPRLVHELAAELGKPATLVIEGEDTEADKAIVEMLVEPLVHVLRNAMDHGIEDTPRRAAAGKPAVATINLRAFRAGEHVVIEVTDDGGGIDVARVRSLAAERNVVSAEELASMSDAQLIDLIFAPGFSTASAVTQVSGRGVGMGAVRTAVSRLGGQVEVSSTAGTGTTVRVTLPFSVLVTQVMTVEAAGQTFGIPLDAVVETIRVPEGGIFPIGAAHAIVLRNTTVPLVRLAQVLARGAANGNDAGPVVIAKIDGHLGALQVDRIGERMEIMLKPLDGLLSGLPGIAGSTLLGDGSVLLILDLAELLQ
jgi:two-component system chemotaxis sensor kinase CheA